MARRVRVCHLSNTLLTGGAERLLVDYGRFTDSTRFDLSYIAFEELGPPAEDLKALGFSVESLGFRQHGKRQAILKLRDLLRERQIDILHTHNTYPQYYGTRAARLAGTPVVVSNQHGRGCGTNWKSTIQFTLANRFLDRVLCVSEDSARVCRRQDLFHNHKIECQWSGIDVNRFAFRGPSPQPVAINVSRLSVEKDVATLIRAVAIVVQKRPDFRLMLVGDGKERAALEALTVELGLTQHIQFLGERRDIPALLAQAGFFVSSSKTEGISLTLLEAMAVGLPIVTTAVGGSPEVVVPGVTGLLAPPLQPQALAQAMLKMLEDAPRWPTMAAAARKRVEEHFDIRRTTGRFETLYEELLRSKGAYPETNVGSRIATVSKSSSARSELNVALVGCGQIADAHLSQIQRIKHARTVAVCDVHEDLAWQAAKRFGVERTFTDVDRMLEQVRPDLVHVTTPAHTHAPLAKKLLAAGCHVYVEKPFTIDVAEADVVLHAAGLAGKSLCVGHDQLFDPAWLRCRQLAASGAIGDVRHVESLLGYPIQGSFGAQVSADPRHWVRRLPGGLFQNTISHPLYRITDFLQDESPQLQAHWQTRREFDFPTELHVALTGTSMTGTLTFSTYLPAQRITRVYGTKGSLEVDLDTQVVRLAKFASLPGAFAKLQAPWQQWGNATHNLWGNVWRFAKADIHYFAGMKNLFQAWYDSIRTGGDPPVSFNEIRRVTDLMDRIFAQCRQRGAAHSTSSFGKEVEEAGSWR